MSKDKVKYLLFLIIAAGFVLRIWGIGFGLPFQFHQDEPIVVNHALAYGTGDLNPHFFNIPPLTSYILFFVYGIYFLIGLMTGIFQSAEDLARSFFTDPTAFYIIGRSAIGVIPGMISVIALFFTAKRFLSEHAALFASAVMSLCFINVVNSHYIYTDMLLVMFIILMLSSVYSIYKKPLLKNYCMAGLFAGLACGVKYNAVIMFVPYFLTHIIVCLDNRMSLFRAVLSKHFWAGILCAALVFTASNPYMILDWTGFNGSVREQSGAFWYTGWMHHFGYSIVQGISLPIAVSGAVGLLLIAFKRRWGMILASFPVVFYLVIVFKSQYFARYVLPLIPFLALGSAYFFMDILYKRVGFLRSGAAGAVLLVLIFMPTTIKSVKADMLFSAYDTRIIAAEWIKKNFPAGTEIACASTTFRPALRQPYSQVAAKKEFLSAQKGLEDAKTRKLDIMLNVMDKDDAGFPLYFLCKDPEQMGKFLNMVPALPYSVEGLRSEGIEYVVISGQKGTPERAEFIEELKVSASPVKGFSPYSDGALRETADPIATTCIPVEGKELFRRKNPGPVLYIYKVE